MSGLPNHSRNAPHGHRVRSQPSSPRIAAHDSDAYSLDSFEDSSAVTYRRSEAAFPIPSVDPHHSSQSSSLAAQSRLRLLPHQTATSPLNPQPNATTQPQAFNSDLHSLQQPHEIPQSQQAHDPNTQSSVYNALLSSDDQPTLLDEARASLYGSIVLDINESHDEGIIATNQRSVSHPHLTITPAVPGTTTAPATVLPTATTATVTTDVPGSTSARTAPYVRAAAPPSTGSRTAVPTQHSLSTLPAPEPPTTTSTRASSHYPPSFRHSSRAAMHSAVASGSHSPLASGRAEDSDGEIGVFGAPTHTRGTHAEATRAVEAQTGAPGSSHPNKATTTITPAPTSAHAPPVVTAIGVAPGPEPLPTSTPEHDLSTGFSFGISKLFPHATAPTSSPPDVDIPPQNASNIQYNPESVSFPDSRDSRNSYVGQQEQSQQPAHHAPVKRTAKTELEAVARTPREADDEGEDQVFSSTRRVLHPYSQQHPQKQRHHQHPTQQQQYDRPSQSQISSHHQASHTQPFSSSSLLTTAPAPPTTSAPSRPVTSQPEHAVWQQHTPYTRPFTHAHTHPALSSDSLHPTQPPAHTHTRAPSRAHAVDHTQPFDQSGATPVRLPSPGFLSSSSAFQPQGSVTVPLPPTVPPTPLTRAVWEFLNDPKILNPFSPEHGGSSTNSPEFSRDIATSLASFPWDSLDLGRTSSNPEYESLCRLPPSSQVELVRAHRNLVTLLPENKKHRLVSHLRRCKDAAAALKASSAFPQATSSYIQPGSSSSSFLASAQLPPNVLSSIPEEASHYSHTHIYPHAHPYAPAPIQRSHYTDPPGASALHTQQYHAQPPPSFSAPLSSAVPVSSALPAATHTGPRSPPPPLASQTLPAHTLPAHTRRAPRSRAAQQLAEHLSKHLQRSNATTDVPEPSRAAAAEGVGVVSSGGENGAMTAGVVATSSTGPESLGVGNLGADATPQPISGARRAGAMHAPAPLRPPSMAAALASVMTGASPPSQSVVEPRETLGNDERDVEDAMFWVANPGAQPLAASLTATHPYPTISDSATATITGPEEPRSAAASGSTTNTDLNAATGPSHTSTTATKDAHQASKHLSLLKRQRSHQSQTRQGDQLQRSLGPQQPSQSQLLPQLQQSQHVTSHMRDGSESALVASSEPNIKSSEAASPYAARASTITTGTTPTGTTTTGTTPTAPITATSSTSVPAPAAYTPRSPPPAIDPRALLALRAFAEGKPIPEKSNIPESEVRTVERTLSSQLMKPSSVSVPTPVTMPTSSVSTPVPSLSQRLEAMLKSANMYDNVTVGKHGTLQFRDQSCQSELSVSQIPDASAVRTPSIPEKDDVFSQIRNSGLVEIPGIRNFAQPPSFVDSYPDIPDEDLQIIDPIAYHRRMLAQLEALEPPPTTGSTGTSTTATASFLPSDMAPTISSSLIHPFSASASPVTSSLSTGIESRGHPLRASSSEQSVAYASAAGAAPALPPRAGPATTIGTVPVLNGSMAAPVLTGGFGVSVPAFHSMTASSSESASTSASAPMPSLVSGSTAASSLHLHNHHTPAQSRSRLFSPPSHLTSTAITAADHAKAMDMQADMRSHTPYRGTRAVPLAPLGSIVVPPMQPAVSTAVVGMSASISRDVPAHTATQGTPHAAIQLGVSGTDAVHSAAIPPATPGDVRALTRGGTPAMTRGESQASIRKPYIFTPLTKLTLGNEAGGMVLGAIEDSNAGDSGGKDDDVDIYLQTPGVRQRKAGPARVLAFEDEEEHEEERASRENGDVRSKRDVFAQLRRIHVDVLEYTGRKQRQEGALHEIVKEKKSQIAKVEAAELELAQLKIRKEEKHRENTRISQRLAGLERLLPDIASVASAVNLVSDGDVDDDDELVEDDEGDALLPNIQQKKEDVVSPPNISSHATLPSSTEARDEATIVVSAKAAVTPTQLSETTGAPQAVPAAADKNTDVVAPADKTPGGGATVATASDVPIVVDADDSWDLDLTLTPTKPRSPARPAHDGAGAEPSVAPNDSSAIGDGNDPSKVGTDGGVAGATISSNAEDPLLAPQIVDDTQHKSDVGEIAAVPHEIQAVASSAVDAGAEAVDVQEFAEEISEEIPSIGDVSEDSLELPTLPTATASPPAETANTATASPGVNVDASTNITSTVDMGVAAIVSDAASADGGAGAVIGGSEGDATTRQSPLSEEQKQVKVVLYAKLKAKQDRLRVIMSELTSQEATLVHNIDALQRQVQETVKQERELDAECMELRANIQKMHVEAQKMCGLLDVNLIYEDQPDFIEKVREKLGTFLPHFPENLENPENEEDDYFPRQNLLSSPSYAHETFGVGSVRFSRYLTGKHRWDAEVAYAESIDDVMKTLSFPNTDDGTDSGDRTAYGDDAGSGIVGMGGQGVARNAVAGDDSRMVGNSTLSSTSASASLSTPSHLSRAGTLTSPINRFISTDGGIVSINAILHDDISLRRQLLARQVRKTIGSVSSADGSEVAVGPRGRDGGVTTDGVVPSGLSGSGVQGDGMGGDTIGGSGAGGAPPTIPRRPTLALGAVGMGNNGGVGGVDVLGSKGVEEELSVVVHEDGTYTHTRAEQDDTDEGMGAHARVPAQVSPIPVTEVLLDPFVLSDEEETGVWTEETHNPEMKQVSDAFKTSLKSQREKSSENGISSKPVDSEKMTTVPPLIDQILVVGCSSIEWPPKVFTHIHGASIPQNQLFSLPLCPAIVSNTANSSLATHSTCVSADGSICNGVVTPVDVCSHSMQDRLMAQTTLRLRGQGSSTQDLGASGITPSFPQRPQRPRATAYEHYTASDYTTTPGSTASLSAGAPIQANPSLPAPPTLALPVNPEFIAKFPENSPSGVTEADILSMVRNVDTAYAHYDCVLAIQTLEKHTPNKQSTSSLDSVPSTSRPPSTHLHATPTPHTALHTTSSTSNTSPAPSCYTAMPSSIGAELHTLRLPPIYNTHTHTIDTLAAAITAPLQFKAHPKSYIFTLRQGTLPRASATGEMGDIVYALCVPTYDIVRVKDTRGEDHEVNVPMPSVCCCDDCSDIDAGESEAVDDVDAKKMMGENTCISHSTDTTAMNTANNGPTTNSDSTARADVTTTSVNSDAPAMECVVSGGHVQASAGEMAMSSIDSDDENIPKPVRAYDISKTGRASTAVTSTSTDTDTANDATMTVTPSSASLSESKATSLRRSGVHACCPMHGHLVPTAAPQPLTAMVEDGVTREMGGMSVPSVAVVCRDNVHVTRVCRHHHKHTLRLQNTHLPLPSFALVPRTYVLTSRYPFFSVFTHILNTTIELTARAQLIHNVSAFMQAVAQQAMHLAARFPIDLTLGTRLALSRVKQQFLNTASSPHTHATHTQQMPTDSTRPHSFSTTTTVASLLDTAPLSSLYFADVARMGGDTVATIGANAGLPRAIPGTSTSSSSSTSTSASESIITAALPQILVEMGVFRLPLPSSTLSPLSVPEVTTFLRMAVNTPVPSMGTAISLPLPLPPQFPECVVSVVSEAVKLLMNVPAMSIATPTGAESNISGSGTAANYTATSMGTGVSAGNMISPHNASGSSASNTGMNTGVSGIGNGNMGSNAGITQTSESYQIPDSVLSRLTDMNVLRAKQGLPHVNSRYTATYYTTLYQMMCTYQQLQSCSSIFESYLSLLHSYASHHHHCFLSRVPVYQYGLHSTLLRYVNIQYNYPDTTSGHTSTSDNVMNLLNGKIKFLYENSGKMKPQNNQVFADSQNELASLWSCYLTFVRPPSSHLYQLTTNPMPDLHNPEKNMEKSQFSIPGMLRVNYESLFEFGKDHEKSQKGAIPTDSEQQIAQKYQFLTEMFQKKTFSSASTANNSKSTVFCGINDFSSPFTLEHMYFLTQHCSLRAFSGQNTLLSTSNSIRYVSGPGAALSDVPYSNNYNNSTSTMPLLPLTPSNSGMGISGGYAADGGYSTPAMYGQSMHSNSNSSGNMQGYTNSSGNNTNAGGNDRANAGNTATAATARVTQCTIVHGTSGIEQVIAEFDLIPNILWGVHRTYDVTNIVMTLLTRRITPIYQYLLTKAQSTDPTAASTQAAIGTGTSSDAARGSGMRASLCALLYGGQGNDGDAAVMRVLTRTAALVNSTVTSSSAANTAAAAANADINPATGSSIATNGAAPSSLPSAVTAPPQSSSSMSKTAVPHSPRAVPPRTLSLPTLAGAAAVKAVRDEYNHIILTLQVWAREKLPLYTTALLNVYSNVNVNIATTNYTLLAPAMNNGFLNADCDLYPQILGHRDEYMVAPEVVMQYWAIVEDYHRRLAHISPNSLLNTDSTGTSSVSSAEVPASVFQLQSRVFNSIVELLRTTALKDPSLLDLSRRASSWFDASSDHQLSSAGRSYAATGHGTGALSGGTAVLTYPRIRALLLYLREITEGPHTGTTPAALSPLPPPISPQTTTGATSIAIATAIGGDARNSRLGGFPNHVDDGVDKSIISLPRHASYLTSIFRAYLPDPAYSCSVPLASPPSAYLVTPSNPNPQATHPYPSNPGFPATSAPAHPMNPSPTSHSDSVYASQVLHSLHAHHFSHTARVRLLHHTLTATPVVVPSYVQEAVTPAQAVFLAFNIDVNVARSDAKVGIDRSMAGNVGGVGAAIAANGSTHVSVGTGSGSGSVVMGMSTGYAQNSGYPPSGNPVQGIPTQLSQIPDNSTESFGSNAEFPSIAQSFSLPILSMLQRFSLALTAAGERLSSLPISRSPSPYPSSFSSAVASPLPPYHSQYPTYDSSVSVPPSSSSTSFATYASSTPTNTAEVTLAGLITRPFPQLPSVSSASASSHLPYSSASAAAFIGSGSTTVPPLSSSVSLPPQSNPYIHPYYASTSSPPSTTPGSYGSSGAALPPPPSPVPFTNSFPITAATLADLLEYLLLEYKVLVYSSCASTAAAGALALLTLVTPLQWTGSFMSLLPQDTRRYDKAGQLICANGFVSSRHNITTQEKSKLSRTSTNTCPITSTYTTARAAALETYSRAIIHPHNTASARSMSASVARGPVSNIDFDADALTKVNATVLHRFQTRSTAIPAPSVTFPGSRLYLHNNTVRASNVDELSSLMVSPAPVPLLDILDSPVPYIIGTEYLPTQLFNTSSGKRYDIGNINFSNIPLDTIIWMPDQNHSLLVNPLTFASIRQKKSKMASLFAKFTKSSSLSSSNLPTNASSQSSAFYGNVDGDSTGNDHDDNDDQLQVNPLEMVNDYDIVDMTSINRIGVQTSVGQGPVYSNNGTGNINTSTGAGGKMIVPSLPFKKRLIELLQPLLTSCYQDIPKTAAFCEQYVATVPNFGKNQGNSNSVWSLFGNKPKSGPALAVGGYSGLKYILNSGETHAYSQDIQPIPSSTGNGYTYHSYLPTITTDISGNIISPAEKTTNPDETVFRNITACRYLPWNSIGNDNTTNTFNGYIPCTMTIYSCLRAHASSPSSMATASAVITNTAGAGNIPMLYSGTSVSKPANASSKSSKSHMPIVDMCINSPGAASAALLHAHALYNAPSYSAVGHVHAISHVVSTLNSYVLGLVTFVTQRVVARTQALHLLAAKTLLAPLHGDMPVQGGTGMGGGHMGGSEVRMGGMDTSMGEVYGNMTTNMTNMTNIPVPVLSSSTANAARGNATVKDSSFTVAAMGTENMLDISAMISHFNTIAHTHSGLVHDSNITAQEGGVRNSTSSMYMTNTSGPMDGRYSPGNAAGGYDASIPQLTEEQIRILQRQLQCENPEKTQDAMSALPMLRLLYDGNALVDLVAGVAALHNPAVSEKERVVLGGKSSSGGSSSLFMTPKDKKKGFFTNLFSSKKKEDVTTNTALTANGSMLTYTNYNPQIIGNYAFISQNFPFLQSSQQLTVEERLFVCQAERSQMIDMFLQTSAEHAQKRENIHKYSPTVAMLELDSAYITQLMRTTYNNIVQVTMQQASLSSKQQLQQTQEWLTQQKRLLCRYIYHMNLQQLFTRIDLFPASITTIRSLPIEYARYLYRKEQEKAHSIVILNDFQLLLRLQANPGAYQQLLAQYTSSIRPHMGVSAPMGVMTEVMTRVGGLGGHISSNGGGAVAGLSTGTGIGMGIGISAAAQLQPSVRIVDAATQNAQNSQNTQNTLPNALPFPPLPTTQRPDATTQRQQLQSVLASLNPQQAALLERALPSMTEEQIAQVLMQLPSTTSPHMPQQQYQQQSLQQQQQQPLLGVNTAVGTGISVGVGQGLGGGLGGLGGLGMPGANSAMSIGGGVGIGSAGMGMGMGGGLGGGLPPALVQSQALVQPGQMQGQLHGQIQGQLHGVVQGSRQGQAQGLVQQSGPMLGQELPQGLNVMPQGGLTQGLGVAHPQPGLPVMQPGLTMLQPGLASSQPQLGLSGFPSMPSQMGLSSMVPGQPQLGLSMVQPGVPGLSGLSVSQLQPGSLAPQGMFQTYAGAGLQMQTSGTGTLPPALTQHRMGGNSGMSIGMSAAQIQQNPGIQVRVGGNNPQFANASFGNSGNPLNSGQMAMVNGSFVAIGSPQRLSSFPQGGMPMGAAAMGAYTSSSAGNRPTTSGTAAPGGAQKNGLPRQG